MAEKPVFDIDFSDPEVAAAIEKAQEAEGATAPKTSSGGLVPDWMQYLAGGAVRAAGPLVGRVVMGGLGALGGGAATGGAGAIPGGIAGVMAGGALGSALTEPVAEMIEPGTHKLTDVSPARVATEAAIGGIPLPFTSKLKKPVESFIRGAALETGANVARKVAAGQELSEAANPANWGPLDYLSPVLGGAFSSYLSKYPHAPGAAPANPTPPPAPPKRVSHLTLSVDDLNTILRKVKEGLPLTDAETAYYKSAVKDALSELPKEVRDTASPDAVRKLTQIDNDVRAQRAQATKKQLTEWENEQAAQRTARAQELREDRATDRETTRLAREAQAKEDLRIKEKFAARDREQLERFKDDPYMRDLAADEASEAAGAELVKKQTARNTKKFRNRMERERLKTEEETTRQMARESGLVPGPFAGGKSAEYTDKAGARIRMAQSYVEPSDDMRSLRMGELEDIFENETARSAYSDQELESMAREYRALQQQEKRAEEAAKKADEKGSKKGSQVRLGKQTPPPDEPVGGAPSPKPPTPPPSGGGGAAPPDLTAKVPNADRAVTRHVVAPGVSEEEAQALATANGGKLVQGPKGWVIELPERRPLILGGEEPPPAPVAGGKPPLVPKTPSGGVAVTPEIAALIGEEPPVPARGAIPAVAAVAEPPAPVVQPEAPVPPVVEPTPPAPTRTPEQIQYQGFVDKIAKLQSDLEAAGTPLKKQLIQSLIDQQTKAMNKFVARMKTPPTAPAVEPVAPVVEPSAPTPPLRKGKRGQRSVKTPEPVVPTPPVVEPSAPVVEPTPAGKPPLTPKDVQAQATAIQGEVLSRLRQELATVEQELADGVRGPDTVTIALPSGGTYKIIRSPQALQGVIDKLQKPDFTEPVMNPRPGLPRPLKDPQPYLDALAADKTDELLKGKRAAPVFSRRQVTGPSIWEDVAKDKLLGREAPRVQPEPPTPPAPTGTRKGKGRAGKAASTTPTAEGTTPAGEPPVAGATSGSTPLAKWQDPAVKWDALTPEERHLRNLIDLPEDLAADPYVVRLSREAAEKSYAATTALEALEAAGGRDNAPKKFQRAALEALEAATAAGDALREATGGKAPPKLFGKRVVKAVSETGETTPPAQPKSKGGTVREAAAPTPEQRAAQSAEEAEYEKFLRGRKPEEMILGHQAAADYIEKMLGKIQGKSMRSVRGASSTAGGTKEPVLRSFSPKKSNAPVQYHPDDLLAWARDWRSTGRTSQLGASSIEGLLRLALASGGALAGAAADEEHPMEGAVLGGLAGAVAPSAARQLSRLTRTLPAGATAAQKARAVANAAWEEAPNYQRFALLAEPTGLAINTTAPIGSSVMGGIERLALGDKRGAALIGELMNTPAMMESVKPAFQRAMRGIDQNIGRVDMDFGGRALGPVETVMSYPAAVMTTGDVVAQEAGARAGIEPAIMRAMTLTNEPKMKPFQGLANIGRGKGADLLKLLLPFKRTALNVVESGVERTPLLAFAAMNPNWMKNPADAVKFREALTRQSLGTGVFLVSKRIGEQTDPENAKFYRKLVSNMAGQYGALAAAGFAAGQAEAAGLNPEEGWFDENIGSSGHILQSLISDLPVPTTRLLKEAGTGAANLLQQGVPFPEREGMAGKWVPRSFIPGFLKDLVDEEGTIDSEAADALIRQYLQELQGEEEADDSIR